MKTILVPVDGSECSDRAIDQAIELVQFYQGKLVLLHVIDDESFFIFSDYPSAPINFEAIEILRQRMQVAAAEILKRAKDRCAVLGDRVEIVSQEGHPVDKIVEYANQDEIDMIVMGSHGRRGFRHSYLGSTTHKVAANTAKPLMIIH
ncbi:MAG: universal stress protein UspA [Firmicutes bacterium]|nr:universal stress protein UspA [Bacillota bacterium]